MAEIASGSIDLKSLKVAGEPNKYITYIDSTNGIRVYDSKSNGNYVNFAQLNSNGLQIYKGGIADSNKVAQFGSTINLYKPGTTDSLVTIDSNGASFTGTVVANAGSIGGWSISTDSTKSLYYGGSSTTPTPGSGVIILSKGLSAITSIAGSTGQQTWTITAGNKFGVTTDGTLYANGANITNINGSNITANTLSVNAFSSTTQQQILNAGRNLVWDSEWKDIPNKWSDWGSPTTREIVTINGKRWLHLVTTTTAFQGYQQNEDKRNGDNEIQAGEKITVSYYAYAATAGQQATVGVHWRDSSNTIVGQNWTTNAVTTTATRYTATYTVPSTAVSFNVMVGDNTSSAQQLWISQVKLEKGESATEWATAPEDTPIGYITQINNGGIKVHDINDNNNFIQLTSSGMTIYKGGTAEANKVAFFGESAQIGKDGAQHIVLSANNSENVFEMRDSGQTSFFKIRDAINENGQVVDTFSGDGSTTSFTLSYTASNTSYTVTKNGTAVTPTKTITKITFSTAPANGDIIVVTYNVSGNVAKSYDIGIRKSGTITGAYSVVEGNNTTASGKNSHAGGMYTTASGKNSFAGGNDTTASGLNSFAYGDGLQATRMYQAVFGSYNEIGRYLFAIGKGYDESSRENALVVYDDTMEVDGDLKAWGDIIASGHSSTSSNSIGYLKSSNGSTTLTSGTGKEVATIALTRGSWIIMYGAQFGSNSTGYREMWLKQGTDDINGAHMCVVSSMGSTNVQLSGACPIRINDDSVTIRVAAKQNCGSNLNCSAYLRAMRIN